MRKIHPFESDDKKRAQTIPASEFCVCGRHEGSPIHLTSRSVEDMAVQFTAENADVDLSQTLNRFRSYVSGKKVRVIAEHNDQPYGRSSKSMRGSLETVEDAGWYHDGLFLRLKGRRCGIAVHDVEFIPEDGETADKMKACGD